MSTLSHDQLTAIAEHLPGFEVKPELAWPDGPLTLTNGEDALRFTLGGTVPEHRGRLVIAAVQPSMSRLVGHVASYLDGPSINRCAQERLGLTAIPTNLITCASDKAPESVAKEIQRRLLAGWTPFRLMVEAVIAEQWAERAEVEALARRFAKAAGTEAYSSSGDRWQSYFGRVAFDIWRPDHLELKFTCTEAQAMRVLTVLEEER